MMFQGIQDRHVDYSIGVLYVSLKAFSRDKRRLSHRREFRSQRCFFRMYGKDEHMMYVVEQLNPARLVISVHLWVIS